MVDSYQYVSEEYTASVFRVYLTFIHKNTTRTCDPLVMACYCFSS